MSCLYSQESALLLIVLNGLGKRVFVFRLICSVNDGLWCSASFERMQIQAQFNMSASDRLVV